MTLRIAVTGWTGQVVCAMLERVPVGVEVIALRRPDLDLAVPATKVDDVSIAVRVQRGDHLGLNDVPVLVRLIDLGDARKIGSVAGLPTGDRIGKHVLRALRHRLRRWG